MDTPYPLIPGYRYFKCPDCGHEWRERSRDHYTPSCSICPAGDCWQEASPYKCEPHPEWAIDNSGNLKE